MLNLLAPAAKRLSALCCMPSVCRLCGMWQSQSVCEGCVKGTTLSAPRCRRCGLQLKEDAIESTCQSCEDYPPEMDSVVVGFDFVPPWSSMIGALKFRSDVALAQVLTAPLAQAIRQSDPTGRQMPDLIIPIPLSASRWQERGYNQAWLLAHQLARECGWLNRLHHGTLIRRQETGRLMQMQRDQREARIRHAFAVPPEEFHRVQGQHVALVDDVMTTGATANEAARVLLQAGAASVTGWFAARTPAPKLGQRERAAQ